jgi:hypothetical protein
MTDPFGTSAMFAAKSVSGTGQTPSCGLFIEKPMCCKREGVKTKEYM